MKVRIALASLCATLVMGCLTSGDLSKAPDLKLSFVIDKEYDQDMVISMFRSYDPAGLEARARGMGVDIKVAREIRDATDLSDAKKLAARLVEDRFARDGAAIQASIADFEAQWKDLLPLFSRVVAQTTESPWVHPEYICVVSSIHLGLSNWFSNKVAVNFIRGRAYKGKMLAQEITLSDVFQLLRKPHPRKEINDWQVWAFSEITASLILDDPKFQVFWPNSPLLSNYPQLAALRPKLKDLFDHRTSYVDYEDKSVPLLKSFDPDFHQQWDRDGMSRRNAGTLRNSAFHRSP
jgi:hypothetical protein